MTKLKGSNGVSKLKPNLVKQIQDKVIALCQKNYTSFEVDGLICITLLDTKEQQVVKIHRTITSVTAETKKNPSQKNARKTAYPQIAAMLALDSESPNNSDVPIELERDRNSADRSLNDGHMYQTAINDLSSLLKETNEENNGLTNKDAQKGKKSKRKKQQPQQLLQYGEPSQNSHNSSSTADNSDKTDYDKYTDSVIIVKEEPVDHGFDVAEASAQGSDGNKNSDENTEHIDNNPTSVINDPDTRNDDVGPPNNQIDTNNQNEVTSLDNTNMETDKDSQDEDNGRRSADRDKALFDRPVPVSSYIGAVIDNTIKSLENDNTEAPSKQHSEWLYKLAQRSLYDSENDSPNATQRSMYDSGNNSGSESGSGLNTSKYGKWNKRKDPKDRERGQQEPDPLGRSWFEMIQSNASKYQAALMRDVGKGTPASKEPVKTPTTSTNSNHDQLKNLLARRPPDQGPDHAMEVTDAGADADDSAEVNEESAGSKDKTESDKSRSMSPVPIVKIEVDEEVNAYSDNNSSSEACSTPVAERPEPSQPGQKPSGKLESKYPALFNQLQQTRREVTPNRDTDSLLNRLPFISFQEIFSQSGQSNTNTTPSVAERSGALINLLNKPQNVKSKKVWNWKKRVVRPKDKDGNIISHLPPGASISDQTPKKTLSKKRQKADDGDDDGDTDWTPSSDKKAKLNNQKAKSAEKSQAAEQSQSQGHHTRLSAGEKPRIDFAEIDISDPEEEDEFENGENDDDNENFELISAFCRYQCGRRFETFGELAEHEDVCEAKDSEVSNAVENDLTVYEEHKCDICGLDFNQEYRWQYHMVKVHGITVSTDPLFR